MKRYKASSQPHTQQITPNHPNVDHADDDDDDEEDEDEEEAEEAQEQPAADDDQDEAAFEAENAETIRMLIELKSKGTGVRVTGYLILSLTTHEVKQGVAQHGVIESLEMHQFMCHKYLTFTFGPQINFIIGGCRCTVLLLRKAYDFI